MARRGAAGNAWHDSRVARSLLGAAVGVRRHRPISARVGPGLLPFPTSAQAIFISSAYPTLAITDFVSWSPAVAVHSVWISPGILTIGSAAAPTMMCCPGGKRPPSSITDEPTQSTRNRRLLAPLIPLSANVPGIYPSPSHASPHSRGLSLLSSLLFTACLLDPCVVPYRAHKTCHAHRSL